MQTVAELQAALQQSQANEARYRLLLEHSREVGWTVDIASGRLTWLSPAAERQFGHTLDSAQALAAGLLHDLPARLERYANGDLSRRRLVRETELPDSAGRMVPVEITSTLLPEAAGRPATLLGFVRDLSAQRALAEQQKKFASMLSHEFRTPLSTIDGAVQRLEMTGAHHDEGTRKRYRKIQVAVDRMLAMLDEYLSPERMASIGRVRQPNEVSPARLLEGAAEQARSRRPQISVQTAGLPPWMRCDPAGMRLCLEIVLDNAIKYTGADIPLELIGKMAREGGVEFLVRDGGAGIAADDLPRVFDKAYRGRNAAGIPGSGLGLYMARAIVDVHGGTISARNLSESGAEFRIWLPAAAGAGKGLAPAGASSDNSSDAS